MHSAYFRPGGVHQDVPLKLLTDIADWLDTRLPRLFEDLGLARLDGRFPRLVDKLARVQLLPVKVQGTGAAREIAGAIDAMNKLGTCEVLIVGRGGGSLEDLWAFNEEEVARAVFGQ
jgi:hypothetical protein